MNDKSDRAEILSPMVHEEAAAGRVIERPAGCVQNHPALVAIGLQLPQFLEADAKLLRIATLMKFVMSRKAFGERPAGAFAKERVFADQIHAGRESVLVMAVARHSEIAGRNTSHFALVAKDDVGGRKARIYLDAQCLCLRGKPAADVAQADDEIPVIAHQWREDEVRHPETCLPA